MEESDEDLRCMQDYMHTLMEVKQQALESVRRKRKFALSTSNMLQQCVSSSITVVVGPLTMLVGVVALRYQHRTACGVLCGVDNEIPQLSQT